MLSVVFLFFYWYREKSNHWGQSQAQYSEHFLLEHKPGDFLFVDFFFPKTSKISERSNRCFCLILTFLDPHWTILSNSAKMPTLSSFPNKMGMFLKHVQSAQQHHPPLDTPWTVALPQHLRDSLFHSDKRKALQRLLQMRRNHRATSWRKKLSCQTRGF